MLENLVIAAVLGAAASYWLKKLLPRLQTRAGTQPGNGGACGGCSDCSVKGGGCH